MIIYICTLTSRRSCAMAGRPPCALASSFQETAMTHSVSPGLNTVLLLERDRGGRFAPGNRGGPGNPFARDMATATADRRQPAQKTAANRFAAPQDMLSCASD